MSIDRKYAGCFLAVGLLTAGCWAGAALGAEATPNVMADAASLTFAKQTGVPSPDEGAIIPNAVNVPGVFTGDYLATGVKGVALRIKTEGILPSSCIFYFYNRAHDREWQFPIRTLEPNSTEWQTVTVPFDFAAGWTLWDVGATPERFAEDLQAVDNIGVRLLRSGTAMQTYSLSDFMLLGGASLATANSLYDFMLAHGLKDSRKDDDKDGLNNWGEFLANSDPRDPNSAFALRIERTQTGEGVKLKWTHIPHRKFAIWRSSDLKNFERITPYGAEKLSAEPENVERVDEPAAKQYFYKVEIMLESE